MSQEHPAPDAAIFRGLPSVSHSPLKARQPCFPSMNTAQAFSLVTKDLLWPESLIWVQASDQVPG